MYINISCICYNNTVNHLNIGQQLFCQSWYLNGMKTVLRVLTIKLTHNIVSNTWITGVPVDTYILM